MANGFEETIEKASSPANLLGKGAAQKPLDNSSPGGLFNNNQIKKEIKELSTRQGERIKERRILRRASEGFESERTKARRAGIKKIIAPIESKVVTKIGQRAVRLVPEGQVFKLSKKFKKGIFKRSAFTQKVKR